MIEEEIFKDSLSNRAAGSIERLFLVTRRFTKHEVTLYALSAAFMSCVLDEHGSMITWLLNEIFKPTCWDSFQLMFTVLA